MKYKEGLPIQRPEQRWERKGGRIYDTWEKKYVDGKVRKPLLQRIKNAELWLRLREALDAENKNISRDQ